MRHSCVALSSWVVRGSLVISTLDGTNFVAHMSELGRVPRARRLSTVEQVGRDKWVDSGKPSPGNPCKAFITFCRKRYQHNPNPRAQSLRWGRAIGSLTGKSARSGFITGLYVARSSR